MSRLPLLSPLDRALFLKGQHYFETLPPRLLTALASYTTEVLYKKGSLVRAHSSSVDEFLFLANGAMQVGEGKVARRISAPAGIGLHHYFAQGGEVPAVYALEDTLCLQIDIDAFLQIAEDYPALLLQLARTGCRDTLDAFQKLGAQRPPEPGFEQSSASVPAQLDLVQRVAQARKAPFFSKMSVMVLLELLHFEEPKVLREGEVLWKEGAPICGMALIVDGALHTEGRFGRVSLPAGAVAGAWEYFADRPRMETLVASESTRVISMGATLVADIFEEQLDFALEYLRLLSVMSLAAHRRIAETESAA